ncbi:MAG: V-type ATP synthase subunit E family protein [candidate division WOR-3 bacterium]
MIENIILNKAKQEAEQIISGALLGASEIIEKAKEKIPHIIDEYIKNANNYISEQRQKILGDIQLKINSNLIHIENEIVNKVFENIEQEVIKMFEDKKVYENYLKHIVEEVFKNNTFQKPIIKVSPKDYEIVKSFVKDIEVVKDENVEYGVVVEDIERGFVVRNTLKTRIEKVKQIIVEKIRDYWK